MVRPSLAGTRSDRRGSVANQAAASDKFPSVIDGRNAMLRCQGDEPVATLEQEWIRTNQKRTGAVLNLQATLSRPAWADAGFRWYAAAGRRRRPAAAGCRQGRPDWTGRPVATERRGDAEPPRYRERGEDLRLAAAARHPPGAAARRPDAAVRRPAQNECRRAPVRSARHLVPADWRRHWRVRPGPGLPPMSGRQAPSRPRSYRFLCACAAAMLSRPSRPYARAARWFHRCPAAAQGSAC